MTRTTPSASSFGMFKTFFCLVYRGITGPGCIYCVNHGLYWWICMDRHVATIHLPHLMIGHHQQLRQVKRYLLDTTRWLVANSDPWLEQSSIAHQFGKVKLIHKLKMINSHYIIKSARIGISKKNRHWPQCDAASSQEPVVQVNLLDHISKRGPRGKPGQEGELLQMAKIYYYPAKINKNICTYTHNQDVLRNREVAP